MELIAQFVDIFLHLDVHLVQWSQILGPWLYVLLFVVVFCETGLVVTPILPGDSLLFAVGALAAAPGSPLRVDLVALVLIAAAVLGDAVNYAIGARVGPRVFNSDRSRLFNRRHLLHTQRFYERYGGKTIIFARFMPIVRTFAPFVAGIGRMRYRRFALFNVTGAVAWVLLFVLAGLWFGSIDFVRRNFQLVILAIIFLSILPPVIEWLRTRSGGVAAAAGEEPAA